MRESRLIIQPHCEVEVALLSELEFKHQVTMAEEGWEWGEGRRGA